MCVMCSGKTSTSQVHVCMYCYCQSQYKLAHNMSCDVCNYSTNDGCTVIAPPPELDMILVSLSSTANTPPRWSSRTVLRVMAVRDFISHTAIVPSCRSKHTHLSNDNDTVQIHVEPVWISTTS